jgi:hypothetical protein
MGTYPNVDRWSFDDDVVQLWFWEFTDEFGKRRRSRWLMTEEG